mmetsp:Transcript_26188/g.56211  ORF Transcript_26188/g.56211 Transcript_26188/m.56211 type:complete len:1361 (-) Transcript_26188:477-4559(-)
MNAYPLRSKKERRSGDHASRKSPMIMVDLTIDDPEAEEHDDANCSENYHAPDPPRLITSRDGCFQSLATSLVASLQVSASNSDVVKDVNVTVKWGLPSSSSTNRNKAKNKNHGQRSKIDNVRNHRANNVNTPRQRSVTGLGTTRKAAEKAPKVGMRVSVRFDGDEMYSGEITKVSEQDKQKEFQLQNAIYTIRIHYDDDGTEEDTIYPDPDISLDPMEESSKNKYTRGLLLKEDETLFGASQESEERSTMETNRNCKETIPPKDAQPEIVTSNKSCVSNSTACNYDEDDYATLHQRYLMPRIRQKVALAGGITLRRQCRGRVIDQKTRGFRMLRSKVDALLKKRNHGEVYRLLCQLRSWELDPRRVPAAFQDGSNRDDDVTEILDLTKGEEDGSGNTCIDVDEYITDVLLVKVKKEGNQNISPLRTPSNSLPEFTPSCEQAPRVTSDEEPVNTGNQSFTESISDSSDYQRGTMTCSADCHVKQEPNNPAICNERSPSLVDESAILKADQMQITPDGIEEVEAYAYAVIETISQEAGFSDGRNSTCNEISMDATSSISPAASTMSEPTSPAELACKTVKSSHKAPILQQSSTHNSESQSLGTSGEIRWDDIPKPPGQLTIDECRDFFVRTEPKRQSHRQSSVNSNFTSSAQNINDRRFGPLHSHHCGHASLPCQYDGLQQHNMSTSTAHCNALIQQSNILPSSFDIMSTQHSGVLPFQVPYNMQQLQFLINRMADQNNYNFSPILPGTMLQNDSHNPLAGEQKEKTRPDQLIAPPIPKQSVEPQSYPLLLPPKVEDSTCELLNSDIQPSTPTNDRNQPRVVQVVTPEVKTCCNTPAAGQTQKPKHKKRKRKLNFEEERRKKLHVSATQDKTCRFSIAAFGFPSSQKIIAKGEFIIGSKREERLRQLNPVQFHPVKSRRELQHVKNAIQTPTFSIIPSSRIAAAKTKSKNSSLHEDWKKQLSRRRRKEWIPNGHLTGRWKPPEWADVKNYRKPNAGLDTSNSKQKKYPGCRKALLPKLNSLVSNFMAEMQIKYDYSGQLSGSLQDVICPQYVKPTFDLLRNAHAAIRSLLPKGDCEDWEVIELARRYYNHWRPKETKILILAESHAFTPSERAFHGPGLDEGMLQNKYFGPRGFISLVYCLAYGENESLTGQVNDKTNKGTPQFWTLFAACARGVEYSATTKATNSKKSSFSSPFAADLLKGGGLPVEERLKAKLEVLEDLRRRGIWLLDASIFGWYMSQKQVYTRSPVSNEVHRKAKIRPPKELKIPSLVLSWELFTKHLIKDVAEEGNLKLLIPIGMEVEAALTRARMEDAIKGKSKARVTDTFPAPNAWIPGGYGPFHAKLAALVNEEAPRVYVKTDEA